MGYKERYALAFDEIHSLAKASITESSNMEEVIDDVLSMLINGYALGVDNVGTMLEAEVSVNTDEMREAIYMNIGGKTFEDRVRNHIEEDDLEAFYVLCDSEFHRVYNAGADNTAKSVDKDLKRTGGGVYKEWLTMLDDRVRRTHDYLEATRVGVNEDFYSYDGDHAPYPGGFEKASNNVNCRCIVRYGKA